MRLVLKEPYRAAIFYAGGVALASAIYVLVARLRSLWISTRVENIKIELQVSTVENRRLYTSLQFLKAPNRSILGYPCNCAMRLVVRFKHLPHFPFSSHLSLFSSLPSMQAAILQAQEVPCMPSHLIISTHPRLQLGNDALQLLQ